MGIKIAGYTNAENRAYIRGAKQAAGLADEYNSSTTHPGRLGDCILGKMNIRNGKPRKNKDQLGTRDRLEATTFALALAEVWRKSRNDTHVCEVFREAGYTLDALRRLGVNPYDLDALKRAGCK